MFNKKVLLRERKRYIVRHVASVCSAALSPDGGVPYPVLMGEGAGMCSPSARWGTPTGKEGGIYPIRLMGGGGYPHPSSQGRVPHPSRGGTPSPSQQGHPPPQWWSAFGCGR